MSSREDQQDVRRVSPPSQRWLTRLIVVSIVMYGSMFVVFSLTSGWHSNSRQRAPSGTTDQEGEDGAIHLLRIYKDDGRISATTSLKLEMLSEIRDQSRAELEAAENRTLDTSSGTGAQERVGAEMHYLPVKLLPAGDRKERALKCVGWRNTGKCSPDGPREPHNDLTCEELVPKNGSGYCEVEDTKSGERFRVMRRGCNILRNRVSFRCIHAPAFAKFRVQADAAMKKSSAAHYALSNVADSTQSSRDGIVIVVYPKLIPSTFATIRVLREILGCSLPIEIWYRPDEMEHAPEALEPLHHLAQNSSGDQISFHPITDPVAKRFVAKIYAIYHSLFDRVLFLDADNVPVRDPSFLFDSDEFEQHGAVFWPDFWHPTSTMFGLHSKSLLWELLDMPFVDMFEQESGQLVVDRRRHKAPLELVLFYATHRPNFFENYKLVWGDKDLFRLAWLKMNATFHMIETPPAMAGMVTNTSAFCGMTMVQHDASGEVLFLHRNKRKLTGITDSDAQVAGLESQAYPDPAVWKDLMSFDQNWSRDDYVVQAFTTSLEFTSKQKCFGRQSLALSPQFRVQPFADLSFAGLETELRRFAQQATQM